MASGSYIRKQFAGGAKPATLTTNIDSESTELLLEAADGWPDGSTGPFVVCIDRGTSLEEKILCSSRTGTLITIQTRGYDDTTAVAHGTTAGAVEHVLDASTIDQVNRMANLMSNRGQLLGHNGTNNTAVTAPAADDYVLVSDSAAADGTGLTFKSITEDIQDAVGSMVTGNTENGMTVTYDDAGNKLNFAVNNPTVTFLSTGDVSGSFTLTNLDSTNVSLAYNETRLRNIVNAFIVAGDGLAESQNPPTNPTTLTLTHADTSTVVNADYSGGTVIQDLTFDGYGHVTGWGAKTLSASDVGAAPSDHNHDGSYLKLSGGTLSGNVTFSRSGLYPITLEHKNSSNPNRGMIRFGNGVNDQDIACADLFAGGNVRYGGSLIPTSSRTVKNGIASFSGATEIIRQLQPVTFFFNNYPDAGEQIGLIAEDVLDVDSRLVVDDDVPGLNMMSLLGLALAGLQEANERISELEQQLETLQN